MAKTSSKLLCVMGKGGTSYIDKVKSIQPASLILYHPMNEVSGSVAHDHSPEGSVGAYAGVTLGQDGIGDGNTCPLFDGANDYNNVYSSAFNSDFNGQEFTVALWAKVSGSGVWADAANRYFIHLQVNAENYTGIRKSTVENRVDFLYEAGNTNKSRTDTSLAATTAWFHLALTVSKTADEMKAYINGSQVGATIAGLGTWAGNLSSANAIIGAISTGPAQVWDGREAHVGIWKIALSGANIASLVTV